MKKFFFLLVIPAILTAAVSFKDLNSKHWAYEAVIKLTDMGILNGYPDGTFKGNNPVTRYQLAVALYRLVKYVDEKTSGATISSGTTASSEESKRVEVKILNLEKIVSDLRRRVAILEKKASTSPIPSSYSADLENLKKMVEKAYEMISNNTKNYRDLSTRLSEVEDKTGTIDGLIGNLLEFKKSVENLTEEIATMKRNYSTKDYVNTAIRPFEMKLESLENRVEELEKSGVSSKTSLLSEKNAKSIESVSKNLNDFEKAIQEEISKLSLQVMKIDAVSSEVEKLKSLSSDVASLKKAITDISGKVDVLNGKVTDYGIKMESVSKVENSISDLDYRVSGLEDRTQSLSDDVKGIKESLKKLSSVITESNASSENLKKRVEKLENRVSGIPGWGIFVILISLVNLGFVGYLLYRAGS